MNPDTTKALPSPLDRAASIPILRRLLATKAITSGECANLEKRVRRELPWKLWLDRALLALGVVLIITGIGYFFAHNWDHLTDDDKLGLSGGAILFCLIGATWAGLDRFPGKLLLLAASALVGVFLAVFGQVYQTGSDVYELYLGWAVLIFPWVALGRFIPLWLGWLALLNLATGFYWPVTPLFDPEEYWNLFRHEAICLFLLNLAALAVREVLSRRKVAWFDRGWSALILLTATLVPATVETVGEIVQSWGDQPVFSGPCVSCVLYGALVAGFIYYYSKVRYSLPALSLVTLGACVTLTVLAARLIVNDDHPGDEGIFLIMGIVVLAIFGSGVYFLRRTRLAHHH